ncbi:hypothetical protein [Puia dinghuensis]|uniref:Uncharacterized protein n=1 Tax=Puia dinghuensis TaxID=1792502 RepID=A0A8J2U8M4_9BACT|nr:hypothetical protein [Puia dinghuensis]GGA86782.1 hypothetical protein GCM10011511_07310 [Puia dinghuensis]
MSGFRLKLNRLKNIPYASSIQEHLPFEKTFEVEYFFEGRWSPLVVKPILVNTVVIFLVSFPEGEVESMALVYNKKDIWADIEKESTGLTEAVGLAIENYYSECYLPWTGNFGDGNSNPYWDDHLLN